MSLFDEFEQFQRFKAAWSAVRIERTVEYSLFTFGDSELAYYLVTRRLERDPLSEFVAVRSRSPGLGLSRPKQCIRNCATSLEEQEDSGLTSFLMSRTASVFNLKLTNEAGLNGIVTDTVEEAVARLNRQLDSEEEDRVAVLSAPAELAGFCCISVCLGKSHVQCTGQHPGNAGSRACFHNSGHTSVQGKTSKWRNPLMLVFAGCLSLMSLSSAIASEWEPLWPDGAPVAKGNC